MTIRCPYCEAELEVHRLLDGSIEVVNHFYCAKVPLAEKSQILATIRDGGITRIVEV
jgi:hypothetical protein